MSKPYIIGTRGSLLALTQCQQIKEEIEQKTGAKFELKVIKTQGDQVTDKALWQLEGKDFFTKELDEALLKKEVDLVVHSYKDLGSERPEGIQLAAVTQRHFTHDILLANQKAKSQNEYIVGTSSPRRIANSLDYLKAFLPIEHEFELKTEVLRGNVNTRIEKLKSGQYDAIILALAGLERLAVGQEEKLSQLLKGLNFMILPHSYFPSAASQGSLAIECLENRDDDQKLLSILKSVEDEVAVEEMKRERAAFKSYGGGCHLAVGIQVHKHHCGFVHIHKGQVDQQKIKKHYLERLNPLPNGDYTKSNIFIGLPKNEKIDRVLFDECLVKSEIKPISIDNTTKQHFLLASRYGSETAKSLSRDGHFIWSAGAHTWKRLAAQGVWVNGSCDSLGEDELLKFAHSRCVKLLTNNADDNWQLLSHQKSHTKLKQIIPIYEKTFQTPNKELQKKLEHTEIFYWTSFDQYSRYTEALPSLKEKIHCCGLGKTYHLFQNNKITINPFASMAEFYQWVQLKDLL